jgi:hypothetical protein
MIVHVRWPRQKQRSICFCLELFAPLFLLREKVENKFFKKKQFYISSPPSLVASLNQLYLKFAI